MKPDEFVEDDMNASEAANMDATEWQDLKPTEE